MSAKTASLMSTHGRLWYDDRIYRLSWILAPQCIALVLLAWIFGAAPTNPSVPWGKPAAPAVREEEIEPLRDQATTSRDAMARLESMAATGNPLSNFFVGTLYDPVFKLSKIVSPDVDKSISYYEIAAKGGVDLAKQNLLNFFNWLPVHGRLNWAKACDIATDQTLKQYGDVLRLRGYCFAQGWGTTKIDLVKAVVAFRGGADLGDARSQAELGAYYTTAEGNLPRDYNMAVKLYKQSADQKDLLGLYNLGACYESGCGPLQKNPAEAARLIALSLDGKYHVAINLLTTAAPGDFSSQFWLELQRQLARRNVYNGPLDGVASPALMSAIKRMGAAN